MFPSLSPRTLMSTEPWRLNVLQPMILRHIGCKHGKSLVDIFLFRHKNHLYIISTFNIKVHSVLYSYGPFALILVCNILLIYEFRRKGMALNSQSANFPTSIPRTSSKIANKKKSSMNRTVILITMLFIIMTGPGAVISLLYNKLLALDFGKSIIYLGSAFEMSYHAFSLIILFLTNKKFSNEIKKLIRGEFTLFRSSRAQSTASWLTKKKYE